MTKCLSYAQAVALDKIWYGETPDGSAPDPLWDNGRGPLLLGKRRLWFGLTRGTALGRLAGTPPFTIATDQVALELQDPAIAHPNFTTSGAPPPRWAVSTRCRSSTVCS